MTIKELSNRQDAIIKDLQKFYELSGSLHDKTNKLMIEIEAMRLALKLSNDDLVILRKEAYEKFFTDKSKIIDNSKIIK